MIFVSRQAYPGALQLLRKMDDTVCVGPFKGPSEPVSCHADLLYCKLGAGPEAPVFKGREEKLGPVYPSDCQYNAAVMGRYFIHQLKVTDEALLKAAEAYILERYGGPMIPVRVRQAYTKCSMAVIDERHAVTSDRGIASALEKSTDIRCLVIEPGSISLPPYNTGFIGGCCGRVGDAVVFNGGLDTHREGARIRAFIEDCGLSVLDIPGAPLFDIGSIISGTPAWA